MGKKCYRKLHIECARNKSLDAFCIATLWVWLMIHAKPFDGNLCYVLQGIGKAAGCCRSAFWHVTRGFCHPALWKYFLQVRYVWLNLAKLPGQNSRVADNDGGTPADLSVTLGHCRSSHFWSSHALALWSGVRLPHVLGAGKFVSAKLKKHK